MKFFLYQLADFSVRINGDEVDWEILVILIFSTLGFLIIVAGISNAVIMNKDKKNPMQSDVGTVLEITRSNMGIEWYVIEFEDGSRKRMRNLNSTRLVMTKGDRGLISYRGNTIESFVRGGQKQKSIFDDENRKEEKYDWRCPCCEHLNSKTVTRCIQCGEMKPQNVQRVNIIKKLPVDKQEWQFPNCGKVNQNYVGTCGCGTQKP